MSGVERVSPPSRRPDCPGAGFLQDFLDGELSEAQARAFGVHLGSCPRCVSELASYRRAFASLARLPLAASPDLTERILDRVVPARVRRRWLTTMGWSYAGALSACLVAAAVIFSQPQSGAWLAEVSAEASRRMVNATIFTVDLLSMAVLGLASGWGLLTTIGNCLAPVARAFTTLFSDPVVLSASGAAAAACAALFVWMRPREKGGSREMGHVGVLGF